MAEITSLSKEVTVVGNEVIVNETTKTVLKRVDLEDKLQEVRSRQKRIKETNARVVAEYDGLVAEELNVLDLMSQLPENDPIAKV